jgi:plant cysteine oxidase
VRGDPIGYPHVFRDSLLSIGIFVLPEGAVIPLHDHPNMTVLSKLIYGSLQVTSYDMPTDAPRKLSA